MTEGYIDEIEQVILDLLAARGPDKTICPSEAARRTAQLAGNPEQWRAWMKKIRAAANLMASQGTIVVFQRGKLVDPTVACGAIRIRLP